jgi:ATP phosphoribosyltransferase regulatory subunit
VVYSTPFGVRDFLPDEADRRVALVKKLESFFENEHYRRIITPTFELFDSLKNGLSEKLETEAFKFMDHQGNLMVLRPDMTTPVARAVASSFEHTNLPLKLYYAADVYRKQKPQMLRQQEFMQAGVELIGESGLDADVAIIELCVRMLREMGIKSFKLSVSHVENIANRDASDVAYMGESDYVGLGWISKEGSYKDLAEGSYLQQVGEALHGGPAEPYVSFTNGFTGDGAYYSGLYFQIFVEGLGYEVGQGGRYDQLFHNFGKDFPAIGFAVEVEKILKVLA